MTFVEFYLRVKNIAAMRLNPRAVDGSRHFNANISASPFGIEWSAYIAGPGYTSANHDKFPCYPSDPESVLRAAAEMLAAHVEPPIEVAAKPDPAGLADVGAPAETVS